MASILNYGVNKFTAWPENDPSFPLTAIHHTYMNAEDVVHLVENGECLLSCNKVEACCSDSSITIQLQVRQLKEIFLLVRKTLIVLILLLVARILPAGQSPVNAVRTVQPPTIDGVINEAEWKGAARFEDFVQLEPNHGAPSTQRTVAHFPL